MQMPQRRCGSGSGRWNGSGSGCWKRSRRC